MVQRILFGATVLFFLAMNGLLWRSEIGGQDQPGSPVPLETVWTKMVAAPDRSTLEIRHHEKKIGYCHWSPNVGADLSTQVRLAEGQSPEGMIRNVKEYTVDFDGSAAIAPGTNLRFNFSLSLATNHSWKRFVLDLHLTPTTYSVTSTAGEDKITLRIEGDGQPQEHVLTSADLSNPNQLLRRLGGGFLAELVKATGIPLPASQDSTSLGLVWEARQDRMTLGHAKLRVYRLHARLFDRFKIVALVSPVGEILRVELPDEILFVNEALNL